MRRPLLLSLVSLAAFAVVGCSGGAKPAAATGPSETGSPASITVSPGTDSVAPGQHVQYVDTVRDAAGNVVEGQAVTWSASDDVATITKNGLATATILGRDTVIATLGTLQGQGLLIVGPGALDHITITPNPVTLQNGNGVQLRAMAFDARDDSLSGFAYLWSTSNSKVAAVTTAGYVTATGLGTDTIQAANNGIRGTAIITVGQASPASVIVDPPLDTITVSTSLQLGDTVKDAHGNPIGGAHVSWASSNPAIATVSATGDVTAASIAGAAVITASDSAVSGKATIIVVPAPSIPTTIVLHPTVDSLHLDSSVVIVDTVKDQRGNPMPGQQVAWRTNQAVATIVPTAQGAIVTGVGAGLDTLIATDGSASASAEIVVPPATGWSGIDYNGGPIFYAPKIAAVYWSPTTIYNGGPTPGTFGSATGDQSLIAFFLNNLGGSPLFNILTTYYDATNTFVQNSLAYTQYWADATAPPGTSSATDVFNEVERGFATGSLTYDPNTLYAVFTGDGVDLGGGFYSGKYCAWHNWFIDSQGRNVKVAAMPYNNDPNTTCGFYTLIWGSPNNDPAADAEVNTLTHELAETTTDENLNAWYVDSGTDVGDEIGDLCAWNFGTTYTAPNGAYANEAIGGKNFLIQMLWVNQVTAQGTPVGCEQTWSTTVLAAGPARRGVLQMVRRASTRPPTSRPSTLQPHIMRPPPGVPSRR